MNAINRPEYYVVPGLHPGNCRCSKHPSKMSAPQCAMESDSSNPSGCIPPLAAATPTNMPRTSGWRKRAPRLAGVVLTP